LPQINVAPIKKKQMVVKATSEIVLVFLFSMILLLYLFFDLTDIPSYRYPQAVEDIRNIGTVDMVVTWAGRPTMEREAIKRELLNDANESHDIGSVRYIYNGELTILLRRAFAYGTPWLRYIHIVMPDDCMSPDDIIREALGDMYDTLCSRVRVHGDSVILPAEVVPCFSSHPKEANLDLIPDLSEQFIYANDDTFLNRPTSLNLFFDTNGFPIYRRDTFQASCVTYDDHRKCSCSGQDVFPWILHNTSAMFYSVIPFQELSFHVLEHQMKPLTRSGYRRTRAMFPETFAQVTASRFRSRYDFSPTILIGNLEMATFNATLDTLPSRSHQLYIPLNRYSRMLRNLLVVQGRMKEYHLLCLNNGELPWHAKWMSQNFVIDPLH
jgi:hypothetical protein